MTHRTAAVRSEVEPIEWAVFEEEVSPEPLTRKQYLAVLLSDQIATHRVAPELMAELKREFREDEIVGLCMSAAIAHAGHVLNEAVRLSPAVGAVCSISRRKSSPLADKLLSDGGA